MKEDKNRIPWNTICVSALAVSFFLTVFVPINAFINNFAEFPLVKFGQLWIVSSGFFVLLAALFSAVLALSFRKRKLFQFILSLMAGFALAMYVQGNLINLNYGVLDGHEIPWDDMTTKGAINTCVWLAIIIGMAWQTVRRGEAGIALVKLTMTGFLAFQCLVLGMKSISAKLSSPEPAKMTDKNLMLLSDERNVIVFMVDTLEGPIFEKILTEHPEVREWLRGFTWHRNTIGLYPTTKGALPQIITGIANDNTVPYPDYKERAYRDSKILREVADNDFAMDLYVSPVFAPPKSLIEEMGFLENTSTSDATDSPRFAFNSYASVVNSAVFTYLPHFLKKFHQGLQFHIAPVGDNDSRVVVNALQVQESLSTSVEEGKITMCKGKRYKFYHIDGVHPPLFTTERGYECFKMLRGYFEAMRDCGIWSRSTIVILADHGFVNKEHPVVLCHDGTDEHPFEINDDPFSYADLESVFCSALRTEKVKFPVSKGNRLFYYYSWGFFDDRNEGFLPHLFEREYDLEGNLIGKSITAKDSYHAEDFPTMSVDSVSVDGTYPDTWLWTLGTNAMVSLPVSAEMIGKPMQLEILTFALLGKRKQTQCVSFAANGIDIGDAEYDIAGNNSKTVSLNIPAEVNTNSILALSMRIDSPITPDFWGPVAVDMRPLGIRIHGFTLSEPGKMHSFDFYNNTMWRAIEGFSNPEPDGSGRWTSGKRAKMEIMVPDGLANGDIRMEWSLTPLLAKGRLEQQRLKVKCRGQVLFNEKITDSASLNMGHPSIKSIVFDVPAKNIENGRIYLDLTMPDAISPQKVGVNGDTRTLAIFLRSCRMESKEAVK